MGDMLHDLKPGLCYRTPEDIRAIPNLPDLPEACPEGDPETDEVAVSRRKAMTEIHYRFWEKVEKTDECWLWTGSRDERGYGRLQRGGRGMGHVKAHRLSWELRHGPIADDLFVLHRCDNPPCVNPDHLFLGTQADNIADAVAKGRNGHAPLASDPQAVVEYLEWHTIAETAKHFGVCHETVRRYVRRFEAAA